MPTMSQIKVPVTGDKMKNVVSDLKNFQVQGEDYLPYNLISTIMEVQTKQNKHSRTKRIKGANNWGNQKRLQKQQTQDSGCVQIVHIKIMKKNIYIF